MKYDHLTQSMESGAEEKIGDIRGRAAREREEILDKARSEGERLKQDILADMRRKVAIGTNKQLYRARETVTVTMAEDHESALDGIFSQALGRIGQVRKSPDYIACFMAMLEEVLAGLDGDDIVLHVDPLDMDLCKTVIRDMGPGITIVTDIQTAGGLNGSCSNGKILVLNTVEDRLRRAKDVMKPEIFRELYGD
jgi:vacuolar-type H+-ATPase subunit E/Vma4